MVENIYTSRAKDYQSEFRQMVYNNKEEMDEVIGKLDDNIFIKQQKEQLETLKNKIASIQHNFDPKNKKVLINSFS